DSIREELSHVDGIIVPGGFGDRGIDGKIEAIRYAREQKIPFFGICLGMQLACVEFARNVVGLKDAHSAEFVAQTPSPIINFIPTGICYKNNTSIRKSNRSIRTS